LNFKPRYFLRLLFIAFKSGLDVCPNITSAVATFNAQSSHPLFKAYFVSITIPDWIKINANDEYKGCSSHYNVRGHAVLADDILPQIKTILGW
jgi:hypothetical protein